MQKQKKDIGWRNWDKMRDEMRDERRENAILNQSRRDVVVIVRRVEAVEGRRMPVGREPKSVGYRGLSPL